MLIMYFAVEERIRYGSDFRVGPEIAKKLTWVKRQMDQPGFLGNRKSISCCTSMRGTVSEYGGRRISRKLPKLHSGGNSL